MEDEGAEDGEGKGAKRKPAAKRKAAAAGNGTGASATKKAKKAKTPSPGGGGGGEDAPKKGGGYNKLMKVSEALAAIVGADEMSRPQVRPTTQKAL